MPEAPSDAKRARDREYYRRTREARLEYQRGYYEANREKVAARNARHRAEIRDLIREAKSEPCADCNTSYPAPCMNFHHLDPSQKVADVGGFSSVGQARAEMAKCVVICANCHALRHASEEG